MSRIKKILLFIVLLFSMNSLSEDVNWSENTLTPDINEDGIKDKIEVRYVQKDDKIIVKFIPEITNDKRYDEIEKVFEKEKFSSEFNEYVLEIIKKYKNVNKDIENSTNNSENKNSESDISNSNVESTKPKEINEKIEKTNLIKGPYNYKEYYLKERPKNLTFNYKYSKNSPEDLDEFLFIRTAISIRQEASVNSKIIKNAKYSQKYKVVGKVNVHSTNGNSEWYEVVVDGKLGYIPVNSKIAVKRKFDWEDMMKKIDKTNNFIQDALFHNQVIYVLDDYTPLLGVEGNSRDKFGNRENQSEKAYLSPDMKAFINVPDRTLMTILQETDKYVKVKIDSYDGVYYFNKSTRKLLKNSNINSKVTRFVYIDRESQNEMIVEKNSDDSWNVVTTSFVTTGKDTAKSFATPYGVFLIANSKPVMQYMDDNNVKVVGEAKNAIRFSGGGYMHSIPYVYEPKETINNRKAITASKIGTFAESHKCVRHYDDQIKFIYDWMGNSTPNNKMGLRTPIVPTIVLVK